MPSVAEGFIKARQTGRATQRTGRPTKARKAVRRPEGRNAGQPLDSELDAAAVRALLDVSQEDLGRALGYSTRSVAGWESGSQVVGAAARLKLIETARLARALGEMMPRTSLGKWLRTPNAGFGGQMPLHLIELGQSDRLWEMIHQVDANVAN